MTKRLVDVDDDLLQAAQIAMGTTGLKDTVNAALSLAGADSAQRLDEIRRLFAAAASVPLSEADRADAWR
jgi:Arc/MetJ family transcription regulator